MTPEGLAPAGTPAILSAEAQRRIKEAEGIYQDLSKTAAANDVTPEMYLLSVLGKYGQYAEMDKLADTMLRKRPGDQDLKDLKAWVQSKSGHGLPATPGYAKGKGPWATSVEEMPTASQKPEVAQIKELFKQARACEADGRNIMALSFYRQALQLSEQAMGPEHPLTAACMAQVARIDTIFGFFDRALPLAQRSLKIREQTLGPDHPQTAQSMIILGFLYGRIGDLNQAMQLEQQALRVSEQALGPENPLTASALDNLATLYSQMGFYDQALPLAQRAVQIREKVLGPEAFQTAQSLTKLGYLYLIKKDYNQAESCFRRAPGQRGDSGMVELYLATGKYEAALTTLTRPQSTFSGFDMKAWTSPTRQAQYYTQKGLALKGLGKREEAAAALMEAIKNIEELRARTPGERTSFFESGLLGGYFQAYRGMVGLLAEMALKGEPTPAGLQTYGPDPGAAAFYFAESTKARSLLEALAAGSARLRPQLPPDLAAKENSLQKRLQTLESQRAERVMTKGGGRSMDRMDQPAQQFQLDRDALQRELDGFVTELRQRDPRYAALAYPQPYKARELPLKPGEVLLEYALGDKESYLFRVEPGGKTQVFRLAVGQEPLEKRLGAMLAPFRKGVLRREDLSRFSVSDAASLYQEILAPALSGVNPGTHLIIVPDGVLGAFPFEALVVQAGPDWGKCTLVADRWPVTYSQSAAILALNRHLGATAPLNHSLAWVIAIYHKDSSRYLAYKAGKEAST